MARNPKDPATNVLYNAQAMAILAAAIAFVLLLLSRLLVIEN